MSSSQVSFQRLSTTTECEPELPTPSHLGAGNLAEANEAIFSLLGVMYVSFSPLVILPKLIYLWHGRGGVVLGAQVSWLQVTVTFSTQSSTVQAATALNIIGVIFNTVGTSGSLLTARWFRLLGPSEKNYLHQRWEAWMRKSRGDIYAAEPMVPAQSNRPHHKREGIVAIAILIPVFWVIGGESCLLRARLTYIYVNGPQNKGSHASWLVWWYLHLPRNLTHLRFLLLSCWRFLQVSCPFILSTIVRLKFVRGSISSANNYKLDISLYIVVISDFHIEWQVSIVSPLPKHSYVYPFLYTWSGHYRSDKYWTG